MAGLVAATVRGFNRHAFQLGTGFVRQDLSKLMQWAKIY
jgi:hypothetical protein